MALHVVVSFKDGNTVEAPFGEFDLWEETEFEEHFGQSVAVMQRYADLAQKRMEWDAENPEPGEKASAAAKKAWAAKATAFADEIRDKTPPQKHMLFMVWLRAKEADQKATPADFATFLKSTMRLEYVQREDEATTNGHGELTEPGADPTSPVEQSRQ